MMGHVPVGRIAILAALVVGGWAIVRETAPPRWKSLEPGVEFGTFRGEPYCRRGSSQIALLRLDPGKADLRVYHCSRQPDHRPLTPLEWQHRLGAVAVFNAGQYYPDLSYMGVLVCGGDVVSDRPHPGFRAALVASPVTGERAAHVLDLDRISIESERLKWREVAQSFMLFDRHGSPRVRRSELIANRTAVAEDRRGRIVVAATEGGYTLWEFARLLERSPLGLTHAMSMDGGREAELYVRSTGFRYANFARWEQAESADAAAPLPAVVAVSVR